MIQSMEILYGHGKSFKSKEWILPGRAPILYCDLELTIGNHLKELTTGKY